jgi:hypothetical protein
MEIQDHQTPKLIEALIEAATNEDYKDVLCVLYAMQGAAASGPEKWDEFQRYVMMWAKSELFEVKD